MLRSFFLALGISALLLGLECLVIEKAEIPPDDASGIGGVAARVVPIAREFEPPEWAPWSLLSVGSVVILYTFTIPKRNAA